MNSEYKKIISPLVLLVAWEVLARYVWVDPFFFPPVSAMLNVLYQMVVTGEIFPHIGISLLRALGGYSIAAVTGLGLGILVAYSRLADTVFDPLIEMIRPISTFALVPVMFLWFGIGNGSKMAIIFKACFFPVVLNTIAGIRGVDRRLIQAARSLGASHFQLWTKVLIPASLPMIMTGLRISTAMAMLAIVGVEMLAADSGIGFVVIEAQRTFDTARMFAGIIVISLIGVGLDRIARFFQNRVLTWHTETSLGGIP